jgi:hypothetical protein
MDDGSHGVTANITGYGVMFLLFLLFSYVDMLCQDFLFFSLVFVLLGFHLSVYSPFMETHVQLHFPPDLLQWRKVHSGSWILEYLNEPLVLFSLSRI